MVRKYLLLNLWLILYVTGCPVSTSQLGEQILEEKLALLSPKETTKAELFNNFGPPMAIAELNEILTLPAPPATYGMDMPRNVYGFYYQAQSKPYFELFSDKHVLTQFHRIYYFQNYQYRKSFFMWFFGVHEMGRTLNHNLWVLVNEKDNLVEDYFFKSKGR